MESTRTMLRNMNVGNVRTFQVGNKRWYLKKVLKNEPNHEFLIIEAAVPRNRNNRRRMNLFQRTASSFTNAEWQQHANLMANLHNAVVLLSPSNTAVMPNTPPRRR